MALEIMSIGGHKIMKLRTSITAICLSVFIAALATPAHAADEPDSTQTLKDVTAPRSTSSDGTANHLSLKKGEPTYSTTAIGSRRASLYSGNWMLFTEENVDFYYDWSRVTSSYGYQRVGAFGFNTVQALGINRSYVSNWQHSFRALTDAGVGTPTPWGNVNVYHSTVIQSANVYGDGAWYAWQG
ncbi:hypothetical protein IRJ34_05685 [Paenarthrobacter sp. GOM3]|uniref:hypothetical protein n=1 Tax=Paenarthrobacter sp. GOM3 TaxID=2782567 RepID=UPI0027DE49AA|nr:hypothetical protein [Paenarthrobacter sp. GOM3]WOH19815.1 hypothetical protein IRJ34_05685 [Paenarthrobacter sp. GOM3]